METAGKKVDDDELRDLMKANGIGRPSTRAAIIETLFRRKYTERRKKQVHPTPMGIQLIDTINNQLLKSAELTGQWEKKLKEIELGEYNAKKFIADMKRMVYDLVVEVLKEKSSVKLAAPQFAAKKVSNSKARLHSAIPGDAIAVCPKCSKGNILKGKNAYGCSRWKEGCDFRLPFVFMDKKLTDNQIKRLVEKSTTTKLKGFVMGGKKVEGVLKLTDSFNVEFEGKTLVAPAQKLDLPSCPKCSAGTIIKGKTAYGCSRWREGCNFRYLFKDIRMKAKGKKLTKELVLKIIKSE
jgi:DNA topoisomerase-3